MGDDGQARLQNLNCWAPPLLSQSLLSLCAQELVDAFHLRMHAPSFTAAVGDNDYSCIIVDQTSCARHKVAATDATMCKRTFNFLIHGCMPPISVAQVLFKGVDSSPETG